MKILVTGSTGQLAQCLAASAKGCPDIEVVALGRPELDLLDAASIGRAVLGVEPGLIVSAAAYTGVDQAEREAELAFDVNAKGAGLVAQAAFRHAVPIIHISTDYVFAGDKGTPYVETDPAAPLGVYG
ncbi:MAG: dTDP-4-dehydrorhamnose reductase, partial [Devosia sp.]|nr:dTDP-4-dehydrorhamnose reductase [Devosia sp.]